MGITQLPHRRPVNPGREVVPSPPAFDLDVGQGGYRQRVPLENRVTPSGQIIATAARGTVMGNRGILHDEDKRIVRTSRLPAWLICRLEFNGRRREVMSPGSYTELFFLDEAVALAAGHRPCGECRRPSYRAYIDTANVGNANPIACAKDLDAQLKSSRSAARSIAPIGTLPDGVFVDLSGGHVPDFRLVWDGALHRWTPEGYVDAVAIADAGAAEAIAVTPSLSVAALRNGYPVEVPLLSRPRRPATGARGPRASDRPPRAAE
jgi:hypothetical protein